MIAIRLVPFATAVGKPRKMSIGRVSSEPPPARVLMNPASMPAKNTTGICQISIKNVHRKGAESAKKNKKIISHRSSQINTDKKQNKNGFHTEGTEKNKNIGKKRKADTNYTN